MSWIHDAFNNEALRSALLNIRLPLGLLLAAVVACFTDPQWFAWALAVSATGTILQLWCFGSIKTRKVLAVRGPYLFVRNPMYLARFLVLFGALLFPGNLWLAGGFVPIYYLYMVNRVRREEGRLRKTFGSDYESYCEEVRPFLPTLKRFEASQLWFFRWEYFMRNHGPSNLATMILFYAACWIAAIRSV
jgi:protein-S-isoprenylcysteine O-methyltransferase Ste14